MEAAKANSPSGPLLSPGGGPMPDRGTGRGRGVI